MTSCRDTLQTHVSLVAKHCRNSFRLPIMCIALHPSRSIRVKECRLSAGFLLSCEAPKRWRLSCFSLLSPLQGAQIGVYIDRFDARCRGPTSADSRKTEKETFTASHSDRPIPGFLRLDVPADGRAGSNDWCAAIPDHIPARRQYRTKPFESQDFPGPASAAECRNRS